MTAPTIEFVNHASVLIRHGTVGLLSDPWYFGPAFHKGWSLLIETPDAEIREVLDRTTHIWLSHEHPDHFSVPFFRRYGDILRERGIPVLFQRIDDRRVADFLLGQKIAVEEIDFKRPFTVADGFSVTCLKDEFYDSALSIRAGDTHILNLNDCAVATRQRAEEIRRAVGTCDILLTQFSYAAWKGGPENTAWREEAARQKLDNMAVQMVVMKPRVTIPFASFVAFSNEKNVYLNDAANTPDVVMENFRTAESRIVPMKPGDVFDCAPDVAIDTAQTERALAFWRAVFAQMPDMPLQKFETQDVATLEQSFTTYTRRVFTNNNATMMRLFQRFSPVRVFQPVAIRLDDLGRTFRVDIAKSEFVETDEPADLSMHSESLWFMFTNTFGFDTLLVNGCLEEQQTGGFAKAAKGLTIENLNNLGIAFGPGLLFHGKIIRIFFERLIAVSRRMGKGRA